MAINHKKIHDKIKQKIRDRQKFKKQQEWIRFMLKLEELEKKNKTKSLISRILNFIKFK